MTDPTVADSDLNKLAPLFHAAVNAALAECHATPYQGGILDVKVFEAFRSNQRQAWLYAQGRTRPGAIVTNASTCRTTWHGYGLAVDIVHSTKYWTPYGNDSTKNEAWFAAVATVFKKHGCDWGGDWHHPDTPHMQWGKCTASPSAGIIAMFDQSNLVPVWQALQATNG